MQNKMRVDSIYLNDFSSWKISFMVYVFLVFFNLFLFPINAGGLSVEVRAESAILMNAETGVILLEKQAHESYYPASTTKIATAFFALITAEEDLKKKISAEKDAIVSVREEEKVKSGYTLPAYWLVPGGSHIGIKRGEELTLEDLLYGLMLASGNDAANVIAQHIGGTIPQFMQKLNEYLKEQGCLNTEFMNPHGLYHPKHRTTAYDMALIMQKAIKNPKFCEISRATRYLRPKTNKQEATMLAQFNKLLLKGRHYYSKTIAGKTGHLAIAGNTFVVAAHHEGRTLIAVLFKVKEREHMFEDAVHLFEAAFNESLARKTILSSGLQNFELNIEGLEAPVKTYTEEELAYEFYPSEEPNVKCFLCWDEVDLPIAKGSVVGEIKLENEKGEVFKRITLHAQEEYIPPLFWRIKKLFK